ncbi:MAG: hypothetical protein ACOYJA_10815 [Christensenellales bacterium]|jgi:L-fucose isomerase-like protein
MREKLKICLVSAVQTSFWGSGEGLYAKRDLPRMRQLARQWDFELCAIEEPIPDGKAAAAAQARIAQMGADFLLIQVSTFAAGEILLPLADTGLPIGLWGVPEVSENGAIPNNSFCGVNMYASILRQYLAPQARYKWFYGVGDEPMFLQRLRVTVSALKALKRLKGAKVALMGGIAPGFHDFYFDERKTAQKLGVRVDTLLEFSDIKDRALAYTPEQIAPVLADMRAEYGSIAPEMDPPHLENAARVYHAFEQVVEEGGFEAIAISCWPRFRKELGIVVCAVIGRLLAHGIIAACEGDVDSAISMMLLRSLSGQQPMLMDMSKFDPEDQTVLMWHCGSAPAQYADGKGVRLEGHYKPGSRITCMDEVKVVGVNSMVYAPRKVTVARLTDDYRHMMLLSGEFIDKADRSYDGSRGWLGHLTADGRPVAVEDLVNTVMNQGFQHHYPIVAGDVEAEMREVMAWLGVDPLPLIPYRSYLQAPTRD